MKLSSRTTALVSAFFSLTAAQLSEIPACAMDCFTLAVGASSCSLFDAYCQCTTDAELISTQALTCICNDTTCSDGDRLKVEDATNNICSQALAAQDETFTPTPYPTNVCQQLAAGGSGRSSGGNDTDSGPNAATTTESGGSGGSGSNAQPQSASSSSSEGAAPTVARISLIGYEGAVLGVAGLAMLAL